MIRLPAVAASPVEEAGPCYRTEYVIEWVGPRSVPASAASQLHDPRWRAALGEPQYWAMAPGDSTWAQLDGRIDGSYDSLAASWPILSARGALSSTAAEHLLSVANQIGQTIDRRAMPMPVPADVTARAAGLEEVRSALDIGFSLSVLAPGGGWIESELWSVFKEAGLDLATDGCFVWRLSNWSSPLLEVSPLGGAAGFSLAQSNAGQRHEGVQIGFSVPLSPDPISSLDGAIAIAEGLGGRIFDEDDQPWRLESGPTYRGNMLQAVESLRNAGFPPGSRAARSLFG